jgi:hypothetical protein
LGIPILTWAIAQKSLPIGIVDFINAPVIRLAVGPIERFGSKRAVKGPRRMIEEDGRVPLLDIGTLAKIRDGAIKVRGGSITLHLTGCFSLIALFKNLTQ